MLLAPPPAGRPPSARSGAFAAAALNKRRVKGSEVHPVSSVCPRACLTLMESLILAQDKRWRRA